MKKLNDFAANSYSQFGEDGIIQYIFSIIGEKSRKCAEFGAGDGIGCSNTKLLRDHGWEATLVEADPDRFEQLVINAPESHCIPGTVTPGNINLLVEGGYDFVSIDVDGDDYAIFEAMESAPPPRVVCIEYNGSIPPHVNLRQANLGEGFGASAAALVELAVAKRYAFIGMTKGNLFFVMRDEPLYDFEANDTDLESLFDGSDLVYTVSDYQGRTLFVGGDLPWGMAEPFVGETTGVPTRVATANMATLRTAFEARYGNSVFLPADWEFNLSDTLGRGPVLLKEILEARPAPPLVLIDVSNLGDSCRWIEGMAITLGYRFFVGSGLVALVWREQ